MAVAPVKRTTKMLGDAGEHYAVSQFTFAGLPATKMPDGWTGYDLAVESGTGLVSVSVKTRSETEKWNENKWFTFDDRHVCVWFVFLFVPKSGPLRAWIIPYSVAKEYANVPGSNRKDPHTRDLSWSKLLKEPLSDYENNWELKREAPVCPVESDN